MTEKRASKVLEIRTYTKGRLQLIMKPIDILSEVWDVHCEEEMSYRTVCRWIDLNLGSQQQRLKDAAHTGHPATTTTINNMENIHNIVQKDAQLGS